jgi:hypothetical protein
MSGRNISVGYDAIQLQSYNQVHLLGFKKKNYTVHFVNTGAKGRLRVQMDTLHNCSHLIFIILLSDRSLPIFLMFTPRE